MTLLNLNRGLDSVILQSNISARRSLALRYVNILIFSDLGNIFPSVI